MGACVRKVYFETYRSQTGLLYVVFYIYVSSLLSEAIFESLILKVIFESYISAVCKKN